MIDFSNVTIPFQAGDLLGAGVQLLGIVGPFVLLFLAIQLTPRMIRLIRYSAAKEERRIRQGKY